MLSISTQENLKQWALHGVLAITALATTMTLGLSGWYIAYIGILYLLAPLPLLIKRIDFAALGEFSRIYASNLPWQERSERINNLLRSNRDYMYFIVASLAMLTIYVGVAFLAYLQTANLLYSAFLLLLPIITNNISGIFNPKGQQIIFLNQYSTTRSLNLQNQREAEFQALVAEVCEELQIPLPSISYTEILDQMDPNNNEQFLKFKQEAASVFSLSTRIQNIQSNQEYLAAVRREVHPNMSAIRTLLDRQLLVNSAMLNAKPAFTREELKGVLHHEFQHLIGYHSIKALIINGLSWATIVLGFSSLRLAGITLGIISGIVENKLSKSRETEADLATANYDLHRNLASFFRKELAKSEQLEQEDRDDHEQLSMYKKTISYIRKWNDDHPELSDRIALLEQCEQERVAVRALRVEA